MSNYTIKDITTLEGMAAIRHRSGMYIGSVEEDGIHHIALEIISNSIDEYLGGYCNKISVAVDNNDTVTVIDNGRGIPFGKAKDGTETIENIFTKLHTGAKFNSDGSTGYNSSGGMNGIGAKATNALSEFFNVTSTRDNKKAVIMFKKGIKQSFNIQDFKSSETGTAIEFQPDKEIFKNGISLNEERLKKQLQELSYLCKGLEISFTYKSSPEIKFKSINGIVDYIENISTNKITTIFNTQSVVDRYSVNIAFAYSSNYSENVKLYTNNIPNTSGTHLTGFRAAMTRTVNECAKDSKLLKEKDTNLTGEDLKEGLVLILSLYMPDPVFSGQTKEVLTSAEGRTVVERMLMSELKRWFQANPNELKAIVNKALLSKKAREAAKRAREATRGKSKTVLTTTLQGKLADCISRDPDVAEIILVEGQSAGGSVKEGRNRQTQAVMSLQGKVLNAEKNDLARLLGNAEIKNMIQAFGCGIGKEFKYNNLRYHKIIIMADADVDGSHIRVLLLTFFFKYMPELIRNGNVYLALSPLYKITEGRKFIYLLDDSELTAYKEKNKGKKFEVSYFKG